MTGEDAADAVPDFAGVCVLLAVEVSAKATIDDAHHVVLDVVGQNDLHWVQGGGCRHGESPVRGLNECPPPTRNESRRGAGGLCGEGLLITSKATVALGYFTYCPP